MACVGRRQVILIVVMVAAGMLFVPAAPVHERIPELLVPALLAYAMFFLLAFRLTTGRSLAAEALAAAGIRVRRPRRTGRGAARVARNVLLGLSTLIAVTAVALWVRGHLGMFGLSRMDRVEWARWDVLGVTPSRWVRRFYHRVALSTYRGVLTLDREGVIVLDPQYVLDRDLQVLPKPWRKFTWGDGPFAPRVQVGSVTRSTVLNALGIEYSYVPLPQRLPGDPRESRLSVNVPLRLIAAAGAFAPLCAGALALLRMRPSKRGHCANCGYDLRATPGRCPECGEDAREEGAARQAK
jgi:hypothetical protein